MALGSLGGGISLFSRNYIDDIDMQAFRDNSLQLDEFMRGDFSSMSAEIDNAFPNGVNLQERYVQLARRVADEQSTLYRKPPRRVWGGVNRAQRDKLDEIWESSRFNDILHDLQMRAELQRTMVVQVLPRDPRRYDLLHYAPHECAVSPAAGARWKDIEAADEVHLLWPLGAIDEQVLHAILRITPSEAHVLDGRVQQALYPMFGDRNPFGRIPLYTLRYSEPLRGRFFASIAEDVLALQIALNLGETDIEALLHHQAWGQKVIETDGEMAPTQMMVEDLPVGSDRIMVMPVQGAKYRIVQGQPQVQPYLSMMEARVKMIATMHDMSPSRFSKANTAQTGAARAADMQDRQEAREARAKRFVALERWMLAHIGEISRLYGDPVQIPETARLDEIHFHKWEPPSDPQAIVQAAQMTDATGETSPHERVALKFNLSEEDAIERIRHNLEVQAALAPAPVQVMEDTEDDGPDPDPDAGTSGDGSDPDTDASSGDQAADT